MAKTGALTGGFNYPTVNNATWVKSWVRRTKPADASKVVRIGFPDGPNPQFGGKYNWLELPPSYTQRGRVFECRQVWLLSGPNGWSELIYED